MTNLFSASNLKRQYVFNKAKLLLVAHQLSEPGNKVAACSKYFGAPMFPLELERGYPASFYCDAVVRVKHPPEMEICLGHLTNASATRNINHLYSYFRSVR